MSWSQGQTAILTQVLLVTIAALLLQLGWCCSTVGHNGPKPSVCRWLSMRYLVSNCLKPSVHLVILLFNAHLPPPFFRLFTQVHLLINGLVKGQYITTIPFSFFKIPHVDIFFTSVSIPPHTHILQIMFKDKNSKITKRNYLNNSKIQNLN